MMRLRVFLRIIYKSAVNTIMHDGIEHAGYLAFLSMLSMFPFMVLLVALAGFLGEGKVGAEFIDLVFSNLPADAVNALRPRVDEITSGAPQGLLTVSILGAIWTASSAVEGYRTVLNRAYHVGTPPAYIWRRLMSIAQIVIFSFLILVAMVLFILIPVLWDILVRELGLDFTHAEQASYGNWFVAITTSVLLMVVSNMYYILPNIRQSWISVVPGALVTVLLWMGAARLFSLYLSNFNQVNLIYGSLGGIIATLLFFYIINVIFIFGAEFNYLIKKALGETIEQKEDVPPAPPDDDEKTPAPKTSV